MIGVQLRGQVDLSLRCLTRISEIFVIDGADKAVTDTHVLS